MAQLKYLLSGFLLYIKVCVSQWASALNFEHTDVLLKLKFKPATASLWLPVTMMAAAGIVTSWPAKAEPNIATCLRIAIVGIKLSGALPGYIETATGQGLQWTGHFVS